MTSDKQPRRSFIKKMSSYQLGLLIGNNYLFDDFIQRDLVEIINPAGSVPVSFIIDDSTSLVNMAHFGIPQFAMTFPQRYLQDWKKLPREIPDSFVREFGEWCRIFGVKGKYSMVPYPACTGWLHRYIPGWSKQELQDSLALVRDQLTSDWDIHPEMISHTRVIDIDTGLPYPKATPDFMENWEWSQNKSADELAAYQVYALNILRDTGFHCNGITTPGTYGSRNMDNLAKGTLDSVREVFKADVVHFFRDVISEGPESVVPQLYHVSGLQTNDPACAVHIISCTSDWFGGWDGLETSMPEKLISEDLIHGRMVEVIDRGEPAIMLCHWPGLYCNGSKSGYHAFQTVIKRLHEKYPYLLWMKLSEIARYWAARELTTIKLDKTEIRLKAPFSTPNFTIKTGFSMADPVLRVGRKSTRFKRCDSKEELRSMGWHANTADNILCFDLPRGHSVLEWKETNE